MEDSVNPVSPGDLNRALAENEARFRAFFNCSAVGAVEMDLNLRFTAVNDKVCQITGYSREELLQMTSAQLAYPEDASQDRPKVSAYMQDEGATLSFEKRGRKKNGSTYWLNICAAKVFDARGRPLRICGIVQDITERVESRAALAQALASAQLAHQEAEHANKAKDRFIAVLSHELRTPLTPALAAVAFLAKDPRLPGDVIGDLELIERCLDIEVRLISDLLDVSRIASGKMHLDRKAINVADVIRQSAYTVGAELDAKSQKLSIEITGAPYPALADAARLQQMFCNLLSNAIKFSPDAGTISIRAYPGSTSAGQNIGSPLQASEPHLVVEISDQGAGIEPEILPALFHPFQQGRGSRIFGGLGLGLSICRGIVEQHGGAIEARSDGPGRGATFAVRLPISSSPGEVAARLLKEPLAAIAQAQPIDRICSRLVLVEDHDATARILARLLMSQGIDVKVAGSVREGLETVQRVKPDVLVCDIGLPDGDGCELLHQLKAHGFHLPAIAVSGYGTPKDIAKSLAAGFREHLVKPLSDVNVLVNALRRVLENSQERLGEAINI